MQILVVGAGGFIGKHLLKTKPSGFEVTGVFRNGSLSTSDAQFLRADVNDPESLACIFSSQKFDVVVHLAAITEHDAIVNHKQETLKTNINGTMNVLASFNKYCDGALFVYASTGKVYGNTDELPISENAPARPMNVLGKSKRITEEIIDYLAVPKNQYLICRIFNIYGGFQKRNFVLPTIIDQLDNAYVELGNITDKRDYLYIDDLVSAVWACISHKECFEDIDYVNIGSGEAHSVSDLIQEIELILGRMLSVKQHASRMRMDETGIEYADIAKISRLTGWKPFYSIREGLIESLKAEGIIGR